MASDKINETSVSEMWQQSSDAYITIKHNSHAAAFAKFTTASWYDKCQLFSHYLSTALVLKTAAKMLHSCVMETIPSYCFALFFILLHILHFFTYIYALVWCYFFILCTVH